MNTVKVLKVTGLEEALFGLGLSYGVTSGLAVETLTGETYQRLLDIASRLAHLGSGHNKFLRQICVWLDLRMPLYWWKQFDQYKIGVVTQSESTMHTLGKRQLTVDDFTYINEDTLEYLNSLISDPEEDFFQELQENLPQGFLQRRIVSLNYQVLQSMYEQRKGHKLYDWSCFLDEILSGLPHSAWIKETEEC